MAKIFRIAFIIVILALLMSYARGETLPSLRGLGTIATEETAVTNTSFAERLEKDGQYHAAIIEWRRTAFNSRNPSIQEDALWHVARLSLKARPAEEALQAYEDFGDKFPNSRHIAEALYRMGMLVGQHNLSDMKPFIERLNIHFNDTVWHKGLAYAYAWQDAMTGGTPPEKSDNPLTQELSKRLDEQGASKAGKVVMAVAFSAIPGGGHLALGDWRTALMALVINALFAWALLHAIRKKDWPYATVWGLIFAILYSGTFYSARSLAERDWLEQRQQLMQEWKDIYPRDPLAQAAFLQTSHVESPVEAPLHFYRTVIGKFDGSRAAGAPVNSLYARQAFEKHGPLFGTWMTVDRLLRDWREISQPYKIVYADGRHRYYDPLARNDFWLEHKHES